MGGRTVAIQFVRAALGLAPTDGANGADVLREAGIPADLLGQSSARVTEAQAARLIQTLWDVTGDEMIGLGPRPIPRGTFRMVTLGLIHSADLGTALRRLIEFAGIGMGFAVTEVAEGDTTRFLFDPVEDAEADQLGVAIGMVVGHRLAGWLIGRQITLTSVGLPDPAPSYVAEYPLIFGVAPTFDASRASVTIDTGHLSTPLVRTEDELIALVRNMPHDLMFRQDYDTSTASRVRRMIQHRSAAEAVTADDVARPLNVSVQHLRRLLRAEGTTFRQIKTGILRDEAIAGLVLGRETIEEISVRLGFSEPSAFRRAFRRWTGSPPGSYVGHGRAAPASTAGPAAG